MTLRRSEKVKTERKGNSERAEDEARRREKLQRLEKASIRGKSELGSKVGAKDQKRASRPSATRECPRTPPRGNRREGRTCFWSFLLPPPLRLSVLLYLPVFRYEAQLGTPRRRHPVLQPSPKPLSLLRDRATNQFLLYFLSTSVRPCLPQTSNCRERKLTAITCLLSARPPAPPPRDMTSIHSLPPEVFPLIFSHLYGPYTDEEDRWALCSAALVCRLWRDDAQRALLERAPRRRKRHSVTRIPCSGPPADNDVSRSGVRPNRHAGRVREPRGMAPGTSMTGAYSQLQA